MLKVKLFKNMGRGLISCKPIKKNTVFHIAEIIRLGRKDAKIVSKTLLDSYVYELGAGRVGIALGFGSLFNHSKQNNVDFEVKMKHGRFVIVYKAISDIPAGKQLFINYGYDPV